MRSLAKERTENLKALFDNTSVESRLAPAIVEKDFWICKFYRCNWAKYELATAKSIKLLTPDGAIPLLELDYAHMKNMIFGSKPPFSEILDTIASLEEGIHSHA